MSRNRTIRLTLALAALAVATQPAVAHAGFAWGS